uniref:Small ribosomal subunit protein uS17c n=1 Tax=Calliarthron tuberculosum TaxID=48942 RepID=M4ITT0_CALTB|nr:30S ribosomal protein S17 [Calliarthron tuberculosum]AGA63831.1 30S ribosomal protein S17 [Calliarthron tuberculosum]
MATKEIIGRVISNKMNKTITVAINNKISHKKYNKILSRTKKYYVHDENNDYLVGDIVKIKETRPISKTKCWIVIDKLNPF